MRKGSGTTAKADLVSLRFCPKAWWQSPKSSSEAAGTRMLQVGKVPVRTVCSFPFDTWHSFKQHEQCFCTMIKLGSRQL